jgi:cephalosporin hydroxylase
MEAGAGRALAADCRACDRIIVVSTEEKAQESSEPAGPSKQQVERVAREFTSVFHDLKDQTFATTTWRQVPLVKTPADILVFQQIIAETRPELIVETGAYVGGSAMLFASVQEMLGIDGKVIAVDIDLSFVHDKVREHPRIELIEGSSTDPEVISKIRSAAEGKRTMVDLDADHRAHHVLAELRAYSSLVSPNCYLVVEDSFFGGRPVRPDAIPGPSEALDAWFAEDQPFESDRWRERFLLTQNPRGYMRRLPEDGSPPIGRERPETFFTGAFELTGVDGNGAAAAAVDTELIADQLEAAAGEPDLEVEALRKTIGNLARGNRQEAVDADLDKRRGEITIDGLLRELDTQRALLAERNRQLELLQDDHRQAVASFSYRVGRKLKGLPLIRRVVARRAAERKASLQATRDHRATVRKERSESFVNHQRGQ